MAPYLSLSFLRKVVYHRPVTFHPDDVKPIVDYDRQQKAEHISRSLRKVRHPEMFVGLTDDLINQASFQPTAELTSRFNSVFSKEQRENLKIILHPFFKRWTIFERTKFNGQHVWKPVCVFQGEAKDGHIPTDLLETWGSMAEHLKGKAGDFRQVTYSDLEFVEKMDRYKYGLETVIAFIAKFDDEKQKEAERVMWDYTEDFLDYNFLLAHRDSQAHYSQPWNVDTTVKHGLDSTRYRTEQRNGYTIKTRLYGEEADENLQEYMIKEGYKEMSKEVQNWGKLGPVSTAVLSILDVVNKRYEKVHGKTLYMAVQERLQMWTEKETVKDLLTKLSTVQDETEGLKMVVEALPAPKEEDNFSVTEWMLESVAVMV